MKILHIKFLIIPIFFIVGIKANAFESGPIGKLKLNFDIKECLFTGKADICRQAIINLEKLQRKASSKGKYLCQSNAIGLSSDLIMTQINIDRESSALLMLEKVEKLCFDL